MELASKRLMHLDSCRYLYLPPGADLFFFLCFCFFLSSSTRLSIYLSIYLSGGLSLHLCLAASLCQLSRAEWWITERLSALASWFFLALTWTFLFVLLLTGSQKSPLVAYRLRIWMCVRLSIGGRKASHCSSMPHLHARTRRNKQPSKQTVGHENEWTATKRDNTQI